MTNAIFIPGNVPSLKNSKVKTRHGIFASKTVVSYLRSLGIQKYSVSRKEVTGYKDKSRPNKFEAFRKEIGELINEKGPHKIGFHFVRKSKHKFDFHNAVQIIADLMVAHDFIEDDNMDHFIPFPEKKDNKWYSYDKENPGVWVKFY